MPDLSDVANSMSADMQDRNYDLQVFKDYYNGDHNTAWIHAKARATHRTLMAQAVSNFPLLIIDSVTDRLEIRGFRLDGEDADELVWSMWQNANMDIYSPMVHQEAVTQGVSYASVVSAGGVPRMRGESSMEVIHEAPASDPLSVSRAFKMWKDENAQKWEGRLLTPDGTFYFSAPYRSGQVRPATWDEPYDMMPNVTGGQVPIVPFLNRPSLDGSGKSEIADLIPVFDRINSLTANMLLAAELAAFKIRWATGIEIPVDSDGNAVEPFNIAMDRLWISESEDAKFGSFDVTPLQPYAEAIDQAIQQAAAISRTPPFLLLGKLTNLSAEALKATESGLVKKVGNRQRYFGESWEKLISMGLTIIGDPRAGLPDIETLWADAENVSEASRVDALSKLYSLGLPWKAVMEVYGATPQQIERWDQMRRDDLFDRALLAAASSPPPLAGAATPEASRQGAEPESEDE